MKRLDTLIDHLRRLVVPAGAAGQPDAALLQRFFESRDDLAFEVLLWRHGPMVLGVCRRVLGRAQDVEDAFDGNGYRPDGRRPRHGRGPDDVPITGRRTRPRSG